MKEILKERRLQLRRSRTEKGLETFVIRISNLEKSVTSGIHLHLIDKDNKRRVTLINRPSLRKNNLIVGVKAYV